MMMGFGKMNVRVKIEMICTHVCSRFDD